jgi:hypothetical protein
MGIGGCGRADRLVALEIEKKGYLLLDYFESNEHDRSYGTFLTFHRNRKNITRDTCKRVTKDRSSLVACSLE